MTMARLAVDIGGTFTDVVIEAGGEHFTTKVLTTPRAPEEAVVDGDADRPGQAGLAFSDLAVFVHGTTLATNAIIERKGARTALDRDGRLPRRDRDRRRGTLRPVRHLHRQAEAAGAAPPALHGAGARRRATATVRRRARRSGGARRRGASSGAQNIEAVAVAFIHAYANARHEARVARHPCRGMPRPVDRALLARLRRRCANTSAPRRRSPTPMSSR